MTDFWDSIGGKVVFKVFGNEDTLKAKLNSVLNGEYEFFVKTEYNDHLVTVDFSKTDLITARPYIQKIFKILGRSVYSDRDVTLIDYCIELLQFYGKKIGVAESITGGLIANTFVNVAGASNVLNESLVCYSNQSKIENLGVNPKTLMIHTAVSEEVAYEMALGLLKHKYNDYSISTTGYAENYNGRDNGGTVYIGIGGDGRLDVHYYRFAGDRNTVRNLATNAALFLLAKKLKGSFE